MHTNHTPINDSLLVRYLTGELTAADKQRVEAWQQDTPANARYFKAFSDAWAKTFVPVNLNEIDEEAEWQLLRRQLPGRIQRPPVWIMPVKWAAVLLLAAGLTTLLVWVGGFGPEQVQVMANKEVLTDSLPDGTSVILNRHATLSYGSSFNKYDRSVTLEGEAFFDVKTNALKPFYITTQQVKIEVLGTSFNLKTNNTKTEITVESGVVRLGKGDVYTLIKAGESGIIYDRSEVVLKQKTDNTLYRHFRSGRFECNGTPLWQLVEVLNEAYDAHIIIGNTRLRNQPLSAEYSNRSLEQILQVVCHTLQIKQTKHEQFIILE